MNILNTSKKFLKAGVCAIMLITAGQAQAQQVTVDASIDSLQLLIGEQAKVKLEISMDAKQKLQLPFLRDTLVKGVEILDIAKPDTQMLNDGKRMLIKQEYTITSFDSALYYHQCAEYRNKPTRVGLGALDGLLNALGVLRLTAHHALHLRGQRGLVGSGVQDSFDLLHVNAVVLILCSGLVRSVLGLGGIVRGGLR